MGGGTNYQYQLSRRLLHASRINPTPPCLREMDSLSERLLRGVAIPLTQGCRVEIHSYKNTITALEVEGQGQLSQKLYHFKGSP